jgi:hypothetical protein
MLLSQIGGNMTYIVKIWGNDSVFKREIVYEANNDIQAIQMASAATPDGCRSTYEEINKNEYESKLQQQEVSQIESV